LTELATSAFVVGLLGGVHCVAMCGGIVGALNLHGRQGDHFARRLYDFGLGFVDSLQQVSQRRHGRSPFQRNGSRAH
jgi:sulfite exporter TauE/SafE